MFLEEALCEEALCGRVCRDIVEGLIKVIILHSITINIILVQVCQLGMYVPPYNLLLCKPSPSITCTSYVSDDYYL